MFSLAASPGFKYSHTWQPVQGSSTVNNGSEGVDVYAALLFHCSSSVNGTAVCLSVDCHVKSTELVHTLFSKVHMNQTNLACFWLVSVSVVAVFTLVMQCFGFVVVLGLLFV